MPLDNTDKAIIHFLVNNGEATTNKIAEELNIGWATTKTHVIDLYKLGYLTARMQDGKKYWRVVE